jgi:HK97 family phage major capsid protein
MSLDLISKALDRIEPQLKQLPELAATQRELSDRLMQLEQRGVMRGREGGAPGRGTTAGAQFAAKLEAGRDLFDKTGRFAVTVETKGLVTAPQVGARTSLAPTPGADFIAETSVCGNLTMQSLAGVQSLIYPRRSTAAPEGAGPSVQLEGGVKTESTPAWADITQNQITIAAFARLSEQAIRSSGALQSCIDLHLRREIMTMADSVMMLGSVVAGSTFAGLEALAPTQANPDAANLDEIEKLIAAFAMTRRANGYAPDLVIVNPADWQNAVTRTTGEGEYINGSVFTMPPLVIAGMRVAFSAVIDSQKALLVDTRYVDMMVSDQVRVEVGHVNDEFIRNIVTVRAELGVLPVVRDLNALLYVRMAAV